MRRMVLVVALSIGAQAWAEEAAVPAGAAPSPAEPGMCPRVVYAPCQTAPRKKKRRRRVQPVVKVSAPPAAEPAAPPAVEEAAAPAPEVAQPYASVPDVPSLDFSRIQKTAARRVYGVSPAVLLGPEAPPVVERSDFGLVVERKFRQPPRRK